MPTFRSGILSDMDARRQLDRFAELKLRLLGDRVSRQTAWRIATRLDWPDPVPAEYLAVATLQADALITDAPALRAAAPGLTPLAPYGALTS